MEEEDSDPDEYSDTETSRNGAASSGEEQKHSAHFDEPSFDESAPDEPSPEQATVENGLHQFNSRPSRESDDSDHDSEAPQEPYQLSNSYDSESRGDSRSPSPSIASSLEALGQRYSWPKLYRLPSNLRHAVPKSQQTVLHLKVGSFYLRDTDLCRLRLSDNMGVLYLDKATVKNGKIQDGAFPRHRVICVVPDAFLDILKTDILMVWPQSRSASSASVEEDSDNMNVKVVLFPSGRSVVPLLINTSVHGPTLLDF